MDECPPEKVGEVNELGQLRPGTVELRRGFNTLITNITEVECVGKTLEYDIDPAHTFDENQPIQCDGRKEVGGRLIGLASYVPLVPGKCCCNAFNAIVKRHLNRRPPVTLGFQEAKEYYKCFKVLLKTTYDSKQAFWSTEWIDKWNTTRKNQLQTADLFDRDRPGEVESHLKRELYVKLLLKKCRMIQAYASLKTQVNCGPKIYSAQKAFAEVFDGSRAINGIDVTFASGMTNEDLSRWMFDTLQRTPNCSFYERDGANWDSTMGRTHHDLKYFIYSYFDRELTEYMRQCEVVRGTIKTPQHKFKYRANGTTKSGHNDTSLGNSIVNAGIAIVAMRKLNLTGRILVMGDDLLIAVNGEFDQHELASLESRLGITPEYNKFTSWQHVSFISGVWYPSNNQYGFVFAPRISSILDKLFWTVQPVRPKLEAGVKMGIIKCVQCFMQDFPIVSEFLKANVVSGVQAVEVETWKYKHIFTEGMRTSYRLLYSYFLSHYQLLPSEIDDCISLLSSCTGLVGILSHPTIDKIREVDRADVGQRPLHLW